MQWSVFRRLIEYHTAGTASRPLTCSCRTSIPQSCSCSPGSSPSTCRWRCPSTDLKPESICEFSQPAPTFWSPFWLRTTVASLGYLVVLAMSLPAASSCRQYSRGPWWGRWGGSQDREPIPFRTSVFSFQVSFRETFQQNSLIFINHSCFKYLSCLSSKRLRLTSILSIQSLIKDSILESVGFFSCGLHEATILSYWSSPKYLLSNCFLYFYISS